MVGQELAAVHIFYEGCPNIGDGGVIMGVLGMHVILCYRQFGVLGSWLILI
jgi:hypothetical protein